MGVNNFTDWNKAELEKLRGARIPNGVLKKQKTSPNYKKLKKYMQQFNKMRPLKLGLSSTADTIFSAVNSTSDFLLDWRTTQGVNPIKNQGQCGSCWAFAATSPWETAWYIKTGVLYNLSEQQLVDCTASNFGCNGGWVDRAWTEAKNGIMRSFDYPYQASQGVCAFHRQTAVATMKAFGTLKAGDETILTEAIEKINPIAVLIYASENFVNYKSGIFYDTLCLSAPGVNHAVTLIGYGRFGQQDFYLLRNSWGTSWGMGGYMWLARNRGNQCFVADYAMYPIVEFYN